MKNTSSLPALLALALLSTAILGCGPSAPPTPAPVYPGVTGNWQFNIEIPFPIPVPPTNPVLNLFGALSSTGSTVTGILNTQTAFSAPCVAANADLAFNGAIDTAGNLTLSAPISGGIATIAINVGDSSNRFLNGTYQVIGGPCAQTAITLSAYRVPNASGTFVGTLDPHTLNGATPGPAATVTAVLTQSTTPNADGQYSLSGTITSTGGCVATLTFTNGLVRGDSLGSQPSPGVFNIPPVPLFNGSVTPGNGLTAQSLLGGLSEPTGCPYTIYSGVLTRQ